MPLKRGEKLGPYEIVEAVGAGGMGEVYRARDRRLDRTVAIKVLPPHLAEQPQFRERFEREARTVSSLNHPHICALHDIGHQDGVDFLVFEFLEGETLERRLARGPLPVQQALKYAVDIAGALAAAHQSGVAHRDLKPGNIVLTKAGPKLLDFGLAKNVSPASFAVSSDAPTQPLTLTTEGTIQGTLQYMSPEQIEGKNVDSRTDIFAFGATLYEMVTGRKVFEGKSQASILAAILAQDAPSMLTIAPLTPARLDRLVQLCLVKDPGQRWQSAHDLKTELTWLLETEADTQKVAAKRSTVMLAWSVASAAVIAAAALFLFYPSLPAQEASSVRFHVQPRRTIFTLGGYQPALSPDGRYLAFVDGGSDGEFALWLRPLDAGEARQLVGTANAVAPFWDSESRFLGFSADGKLKKISLDGTVSETLTEAFQFANGAWGPGGLLVFGSFGLSSITEPGGTVTPIPGIDRREGRYFWSPEFLPGGKHILYTVDGPLMDRGVYIHNLESSTHTQLLPGSITATYADPGILLVMREQKLFAYSFDLASLTILPTEPTVIAEGVGSRASVSNNGILAYSEIGGFDTQIVWRNRKGEKLETIGVPERFWQVRLAPDGRRAVLNKTDSTTLADDIWLLTVPTGVLSKLTLDSANEFDPVWSPDSLSVAFASDRTGNKDIYRIDIGGGKESRVGGSAIDEMTEDWSQRNALVLHAGLDDRAGVSLMPLDANRQPEMLLPPPGYEIDEFKLSPDEKWIAYASRQSGRYEVWVATFPEFKQRRQVSDNGGSVPRWRKDSRELFYLALDSKIMAVDVTPGPTITTGRPRSLFQTRINVNGGTDQYDVTDDGERFLLLEPPDNQLPPAITVITNWRTLLKRNP